MLIISLSRRRISLSRTSRLKHLHLHFMSVISTFVGPVINDNHHHNNPSCLYGHIQFTKDLPILHNVIFTISLDLVNGSWGKAECREMPSYFYFKTGK